MALKKPSRHRRGSAQPVDINPSVLTEEITTTKSHPVVPELSAQLLPEPIVSVSDPEFAAFNEEEDKSAESSSSRKNPSNDNESEKNLPPLFERVTSVDESVTPIIENDSNELNLEIIPLLPGGEKSLTLTDWSMRSLIPEPPSGFQDSIVTDNTILNMIPDPLDTNNIVMDKVPTITGPMKFSINSYNERTVKENSYNPVKLCRTESTREVEINHSQINLNKSSPTMPTLTKSESFGFARFNGNSTLAGNQSLSNLLIISVFY